MELLYTVVAVAAAIAVPCFALYDPRHRGREHLLVCVGSAGALGRLMTARLQSGAAGEAPDTWTTLLHRRATDLVGKDTIRSQARRVEPYVDGHAVG